MSFFILKMDEHLLGMTIERDEGSLRLGFLRFRLPARPRHSLGVELLLGELAAAPHCIVHERLVTTTHSRSLCCVVVGVGKWNPAQTIRSDLGCRFDSLVFSRRSGGWNA